MQTHPWNVVFFVAFVAFIFIRAAFKRRTKNNDLMVRRMDGVEKLLLLILAPGTLFLPLLYLFTPWLGFADYSLPSVVPWCGAAVLVAALWLFWRSHAELGQNWSQTLELRKGHELVTSGVYRSIRHPMYAAIWLWCLGQGLLLENWLAGWYALAAFALLYFVRTPREERMMCEHFGNAYREYMQRTGRILPWATGPVIVLRDTKPGV